MSEDYKRLPPKGRLAVTPSRPQCDHSFVFLRQEKKNVGFDRNPTWHFFDLFFCQKCLACERVSTEEQK